MIDHPEDISGLFIITNAPPAPFIPINMVGTLIGVSLLISTQPKERAMELIRPLKELSNERLDHVDSAPYLAIQTLADPLEPPDLRHHWKSHYVGKLDENALFDLIELRRKSPFFMSQIHLEPWGGKIKESNNAFSFKNAEFAINIIGKWTDEKDDPKNIEWVRSTWNALKKYSIGGGYVNYEGDVNRESFRYSYDQDMYLKLKEIKRKYDPENFFHNNQNINLRREQILILFYHLNYKLFLCFIFSRSYFNRKYCAIYTICSTMHPNSIFCWKQRLEH